MKKVAYHIVLVLLVLAFMVAFTGCGAALKDAAKLDEYDMGGDQIPSITSVVGEREVTNISSETNNGAKSIQYTYVSDAVYDDLWAYVQKLMDDGWVVTQDIDLNVIPGSGQLGKNASEEGQILLLSFAYEDGKYAIKITKAEGTIETGESANTENPPADTALTASEPAVSTEPAATDSLQEENPNVSDSTSDAAGIAGNWSYIDDSEDLKKQTYYIFKEDGAYLQFDISIVTEQYLSTTVYRGKYEISGDKLLLTGREKTAYSAASIDEVIEQAEAMIYTPLEDEEADFGWDGADRLLIGGIELSREK